MAEALVAMGMGSISAGFTWLFNRLAAADPDGDAGLVVKAQAEHRSALVAKADAIVATEREKAQKKEGRQPSHAAKMLAETVKHFIDLNAKRLVEGHKNGLFDLSHLKATQPKMVATVYAHNREVYGWEFGPRLPGLPPSRLTREAAQTMAHERGYPPAWVDIVAPVGTVVLNSAQSNTVDVQSQASAATHEQPPTQHDLAIEGAIEHPDLENADAEEPQF